MICDISTSGEMTSKATVLARKPGSKTVIDPYIATLPAPDSAEAS
jgi:hypothetical protein